MAQFLEKTGDIKLTSTWTVLRDPETTNELYGKYSFSTPTVGYKHWNIDLSSIPLNAIIESVSLKVTEYLSGNFLQYPNIYIKNGGSLTATNNNIKGWLEEHRTNQDYSSFGLVFQTRAKANQKAEGEFEGSRTYNVSCTFTNISLEINYQEPVDTTLKGPTISSLKIIDTWDRSEKLNFLEKKEGVVDSLISYRIAENYFNSNVFVKESSNFSFSCKASSLQNNSPNLNYKLLIMRDGSSEIFYESENNATGVFNLPYSVFSKENNFSNIKNYLMIKYNFSVKVTDSANKTTELLGSFYLIEISGSDGGMPIISTFEVKRVGYVLNEAGSGYELIESNEGELVSTIFEIKLTIIPRLVYKNTNNTYIIELETFSYRKYWEDLSQPENFFISESIALSNGVNKVLNDISFFCGNSISGGDVPKYETTFSSTNTYLFKIIIEKNSISILEKTDEIEEAFGYLSVELGGVAIGERHPGITEEDSKSPTFLVNLPTTFKKQIILIEDFSYGEAEPSTIFTKSNNLAPVEGQIYFRLL